MVGMRTLKIFSLAFVLLVLSSLQEAMSHGVHPLSKIALHNTKYALDELAFVKVSPTVLGLKVYSLQLHRAFDSLSNQLSSS